MAQERVKGYVVGSDMAPWGSAWKVRIDKESTHPFGGKKFFVASIGDDSTLAPGLNVDFFLETQQWKGITVAVATDVRIATPAEVPPTAAPKASAKEKEPDDVFTVYVAESNGRRSLAVNGFWTVDEVTKDTNDASGGEERVIAARSFTADELGGVFHVVRGISVMDGEVVQLETFLNHIFELGVEYQKKASQS